MKQSLTLPSRVQNAIIKQQYQSEILVGIAQLCLVIFLAVLYILSPTGYSPDAPVKAVPLGLSLFSIFVLLRLYFLITGQLKSWLIGFFAIIEMAILIGTIWVYHIQYEQPALIYLKNTVFLYVFILIALRALRFEALWVILSGLVAVVGWLLLLGYAFYTANDNILTWDYVTYATTGKVHLGSEFDKILSVLVVTFILTLVLIRARRILIQSTVQTQATADLSLFFDHDVVKRITHADNAVMAGQGELRKAAILFTDLRGFTQASINMSPSELITLLSEYQRLIIPIVRQYNGSIDKFMGDGILASFGAVTTSMTYAADGFKAVDNIMQAAYLWGQERKQKGLPIFNIGAGLAIGEVVFGTIGDEKRLEYTVIGDTVNLAAKLEKYNKTLQSNALSTKNALEIAQAQGYKTDSEKNIYINQIIHGVSEPLDLVVWK
ncbi:MAG: adenylate/guanylate cyclase domain-containing protein [Alphaproteobacteria bacterium]|nr:adenylate/guanylate cyclase domain-containing protein [Alphaproteobacteria bacterium]